MHLDDILYLTSEEAKIIYWSARGKDIVYMAGALSKGQSTIHVDKKIIQAKLKTDDWKAVENELGTVLLKVVAGDPGKLKKWPEGFREKLEPFFRVSREKEGTTTDSLETDSKDNQAKGKSLENSDQDAVPPIGEAEKGKKFPIGTVLGGGLVLVSLLAIGMTLWALNQIRNQPEPIVVTEIITQLVTQIAFEPTRSLLTENVPTQPPATDAPTQQPTQGIAPLIVPTDTLASVPTDTTPTATLAPTPQSMVLFEDNFDDGLADEWTVEYGSPVLVDGKLSASEETWFSVGDPSWTDYIVSFWLVTPNSPWYNTGNNIIGVRAPDLDNMIAYRFASYEGDFRIRKSGTWNEIPGTGGRGYGVYNKLVKLVVEGEKITIYVGDKKLLDYINTEFPQGKVYLRLKQGAQIDDFVVESLP